MILKDRHGPARTAKQALAALALLVVAVSPALAADDHGRQPTYTFTLAPLEGDSHVLVHSFRPLDAGGDIALRCPNNPLPDTTNHTPERPRT
jgi:hypothetical protein